MALDIPFYRYKEMVQLYNGGVAMCERGWRRSALSPVRVLTWPSEKCLEPRRSIAGGAAWILLTFPCFVRSWEQSDVMGARGEPSLPVTGVI
jgi:hypothetical protein